MAEDGWSHPVQEGSSQPQEGVMSQLGASQTGVATSQPQLGLASQLLVDLSFFLKRLFNNPQDFLGLSHAESQASSHPQLGLCSQLQDGGMTSQPQEGVVSHPQLGADSQVEVDLDRFLNRCSSSPLEKALHPEFESQPVSQELSQVVSHPQLGGIDSQEQSGSTTSHPQSGTEAQEVDFFFLPLLIKCSSNPPANFFLEAESQL